jgi:predicted nucleic-acid-binding protein
VLLRVYPLQPADVAQSLRVLVAAANVEVNRSAVDAGLAMLAAGSDFSDGLIPIEGQWPGGETFVSFDKRAVALLAAQGKSARLLEAETH